MSIVGHSGSGKSTFLSLIGGIARPDTGTVIIDGNNIWDYDDRELSRMRNDKFGFVYQFASLIPTLTAKENVLLPTVFGNGRRTDEPYSCSSSSDSGTRSTGTRPSSPAANSSG